MPTMAYSDLTYSFQHTLVVSLSRACATNLHPDKDIPENAIQEMQIKFIGVKSLCPSYSKQQEQHNLTNWTTWKAVLRRENIKAHKIIIVDRTYSIQSGILEWKNKTIEQWKIKGKRCLLHLLSFWAWFHGEHSSSNKFYSQNCRLWSMGEKKEYPFYFIAPHQLL